MPRRCRDAHMSSEKWSGTFEALRARRAITVMPLAFFIPGESDFIQECRQVLDGELTRIDAKLQRFFFIEYDMPMAGSQWQRRLASGELKYR